MHRAGNKESVFQKYAANPSVGVISNDLVVGTTLPSNMRRHNIKSSTSLIAPTELHTLSKLVPKYDSMITPALLELEVIPVTILKYAGNMSFSTFNEYIMYLFDFFISDTRQKNVGDKRFLSVYCGLVMNILHTSSQDALIRELRAMGYE